MNEGYKRARGRWVRPVGEDGRYSQTTPKADAFLRDVIAVCKKHGMWLGHEDPHGSFEIVTESTEDWLWAANDARVKGAR